MEPLLRDFFKNDNNNQSIFIRKVFGSYKDFEKELNIVFGEVDEKRITKK